MAASKADMAVHLKDKVVMVVSKEATVVHLRDKAVMVNNRVDMVSSNLKVNMADLLRVAHLARDTQVNNRVDTEVRHHHRDTRLACARHWV